MQLFRAKVVYNFLLEPMFQFLKLLIGSWWEYFFINEDYNWQNPIFGPIESINYWNHIETYNLICYFLWLIDLFLKLHAANIFVVFCSNAAKHEGRLGEHYCTLDGETNHAVAIFCILGWGHVLLASQQHLPPPLLPLWARIIHHAQAWLCRNCCPYIYILLSSCLLLLHVQPLLL